MIIVEELLEGETLQKHLDEMRKGSVAPDLKLGLTLALQISNAMEELHDHDILHRDLKPGKNNIFITFQQFLVFCLSLFGTIDQYKY